MEFCGKYLSENGFRCVKAKKPRSVYALNESGSNGTEKTLAILVGTLESWKHDAPRFLFQPGSHENMTLHHSFCSRGSCKCDATPVVWHAEPPYEHKSWAVGLEEFPAFTQDVLIGR